MDELLWVSSTKSDDMDPEFISFNISDLLNEMDEKGGTWFSFIDGQNLLTGVYRLKAGSIDHQSPHETDEVYYVLSGRSKFKAGETIAQAKSGDILFVRAGVEHKFFEIEEDIVLLVVFDK